MTKPITVHIYPTCRHHRISPYLYGQFAEHLGRCIYGGLWVGEGAKIPHERGIRRDTSQALARLALPVLRWPGGCFADNYHWRDGIGPRGDRPRRHNLWWNQPETNAFGTDEFLRLCAMIGTEPYICVNVGSGTVQEAADWLDYCNGNQDTTLAGLRAENGHPEPYGVRYWGVGNENWGCGGRMRPEYYADLYARFATYLRGRGGPEKLVACGSNPSLPDWDERFLMAIKGRMRLLDYVAVHVYSGRGGSATEFADEEYWRLVIDAVEHMDVHLRRTCALVEALTPNGREVGVIMDEWGTWFNEATVESGLYQQNTLRDALFAAASFHRFHAHPRLHMANMAQTVNVLQALVLTRGRKMLLTPTWHVYEMLMPHRRGTLIETRTDAPALTSPTGMSAPSVSVSASAAEEGDLFLSVVNLDLQTEQELRLQIEGERLVPQDVRHLTAPDIRAHNTFDEPERIAPYNGVCTDGDTLVVPAKSLTTVRLTKGEQGTRCV